MVGARLPLLGPCKSYINAQRLCCPLNQRLRYVHAIDSAPKFMALTLTYKQALSTGARLPKPSKRKEPITDVWTLLRRVQVRLPLLTIVCFLQASNPAEHSEPAKKKAKGAVKLEVKVEQTPRVGKAKVGKARTVAIPKTGPAAIALEQITKSEGRRAQSKATEDGEAAASSATAHNPGQGRAKRRSVRNSATT